MSGNLHGDTFPTGHITHRSLVEDSMESTRFDRLTRSWSSYVQRRTTVGALVGGLLGLSALTKPEVAVGKKSKKIAMCLNGQPLMVKKSKKGKLIGQGATVGACQTSPPPPPPPRPSPPACPKRCNGACIPATSCCFNSECDFCKQRTCQSGDCACKPGTVADARGFCGTPVGISCGVAYQIVNNPALCCSQNFRVHQTVPPLWQCLPGTTQCVIDQDCASGPCRGFMCPERYIVTVGDLCADAI